MANVLTPALRAYLDEQAALPFVWGQSDCGHFAAGWIARLRGDALPERFGRYDSEKGCTLYVVRCGGMIMLAARAFRQLGLAELSPVVQVEDGDVALVEVDKTPAFAIRAGNAWAFKSPEGLTFAVAGRVLALARWKPPCRPSSPE